MVAFKFGGWTVGIDYRRIVRDATARVAAAFITRHQILRLFILLVLGEI